MRMRVTIEVDYDGTLGGFRACLRNSMNHGRLKDAIDGEIVYIASEEIDATAVAFDGRAKRS